MTLKNQMQTYSGRRFDFDAPNPDAIITTDIAHHLAKLCRYTGACLKFYSVAEHSVLVSRVLAPEYAFEGLMHDAAEAYLNDIGRGHKRKIKEAGGYVTAFRVEGIVAAKYGLPWPVSPQVKDADSRMCATERAQIMAEARFEWNPLPPAYEDVEIQCWSPDEAALMFMQRFTALATLENGH